MRPPCGRVAGGVVEGEAGRLRHRAARQPRADSSKHDTGTSSGTHLHDCEEDDVHLSVCNYSEEAEGSRALLNRRLQMLMIEEAV